MSEQQQKWSGQSVAGRYSLGKYLGGTDHSAVFATEIVHARSQQVAIKLIPSAGVDVDRQLARWKSLSSISHTNLLKILDYGKCELDGDAYLFIVMEHADEDLADILPQRALNEEETRGMIEPVLETLAFLHQQKLVHTRIHPGNILAMGDQIKLSSDSISPEGEPVGFATSAAGFSPPEWGGGTAASGEDVWSLGATIVAALTQKAPTLGEDGEAVGLESLPEPFATIALGSLKKEPSQRISMAGIRAKLNPASAPSPVAVAAVIEAPKPAKEIAKIDPVAVPLSKVPLPVVSERRAPVASARPTVAPDGGKKSYWVPLVGFAVVAIVLLSLPKLFRHETEATPKQDSSKISLAMPKKNGSGQPALKETSQPTNKVTSAPVKVPTKVSAENTTRGEVLDQVLPDVSEKARATIQGKVRVSVRVQVNPSGTVDAADLDMPAGSKYFSDQAIKAAKRWQFSAPEVDGHSVASEWLLHFEFTPSGTTVRPTQVSP